MASIRPGRVWKAAELPRGVRSRREHSPLFDALRETAETLQRQLVKGTLKSTDLVREYIWRIQEHNGYLNAVWELAPDVMERAEDMDARRAAGTDLGPLHGIPILLKDNIAVDARSGMGCCAGAAALLGSTAPRHATIVEQLLNAGCIILGKATLSELAYHKGKGLPCGWSAVAGQGQSAYVHGGLDPEDTIAGHSSPGGSSSGSAIAVSAGLAPIAIGSETEGSLVNPSIRASLYTIKPSIGLVSGDLVVPITPRCDTPGPMTKSPSDLAQLLAAISKPLTFFDRGPRTRRRWQDLKIGTLDPKIWMYPPVVLKPNEQAEQQMIESTEEAYTWLKSRVARYVHHLALPTVDTFDWNGGSAFGLMMSADFEAAMDHYLSQLCVTKVRTLKEMIAWNEENPGPAFQEYKKDDWLTDGLRYDGPSSDVLMAHVRGAGQQLLDILEKEDLDVIIGPGDCFLTQYAAALECPIGAMPLSYLDFNGRPIGLQVLAPRHREDLIIDIMREWEETRSPRKPPTAFQQVAESQKL